MSASTTESVIQAYQATLTSQDSSATKNTRPQVRASANVTRGRFPQTARISSAGPTTASGQNPTGGNAPGGARAAPDAPGGGPPPPRPRPPAAGRPGAS